MKMCIKIWIILLISPCGILSGQAVYEHITNKNIYDFLDELAAENLLSLNSNIKPYTRTYIYKLLKEIEKDTDKLNIRQVKELNYYMDYYSFGNQPDYLPTRKNLNLFRKSFHSATSLNHFGYFYSDSIFMFSIRPIVGMEYYSNSSGNYTHTYGGLEAFASLTKYLSFYANLRDNTVSDVLKRPGYFSQEPAGVYKESIEQSKGADFSEMRGGLMLSWDFLEIGIVKDHITWGNNYNGAIIQSGLTPSFPMIKLHINPTKWFDFNYIHAWLVSDVIDSTLTYLLPNGIHRDTYKNKYLAANMFTIIPIKGLQFSFGNSIIYSDQNVNPAYLLPVFFYKSVDHTLTSYKIVNQNSQMFIDISLRLLKHTHFFVSAFWDEFSTTRISDPETHNFYSYKIGARISNWPISNLSVLGEYYKSVPITYMHYIPTLTYETNSYNMGHWLQGNSEEKFFAIKYKAFPRMLFQFSYLFARHGNDYIYNPYEPIDSYPILDKNTWTNSSQSFSYTYEFLTNCYFSFEFLHSNIKGYDIDGQSAQYYLDKYSPAFFQGKKNTLMLRMNFGL